MAGISITQPNLTARLKKKIPHGITPTKDSLPWKTRPPPNVDRMLTMLN